MKHFFDVGANVGQTFDDFICPTNEFDGWTIWLFEPSPRHVPALIERAAKERDRYKIRICPFGLWISDAIVRLWEKDDGRGDSFEENLNQTCNLKSGYEIHAAVFPFASFLMDATEDGDRVTVKIDAEGAEYAILNDLIQDHHKAARDRIERLYVEFHHCGAAWKYPPREETEERFKAAGLPIEGWMF